jgi:hypothetical protein
LAFARLMLAADMPLIDIDDITPIFAIIFTLRR